MKLKEKKGSETCVSKEQIIAGLVKLGLKKSDIVGIHSSLSSFGHVEGGADAVIDALLAVVGEEGTIVMPTFSTNRVILDLTPEMKAAGASWLLRVLPYDPKQTSCWTGTIPETFRKRNGVLRSHHPLFSLAATGPEAETIIEAGREGALPGWKKVLELDGYVLLIGIGLERCTAIHLAEEHVKLPRHIKEKLTPPKWFLEKYPANEWDWDFGPYPDFKKMETHV
jgi:aminoglycoside 3-N-acetyltransferase